MVVCLSVCGCTCTAVLEHGWVGPYRAYRALGIVTCGDNRLAMQIYLRGNFSRSDAAHMERVYKVGPLHAETAGALQLKTLVVFTPMFYSRSKDRRGHGTAL